MRVFCLFLIVLCLACQREEEPPPRQIIIYETQQPQQLEPETITVVLVQEDKSPPRLVSAPVKDGQGDVNAGEINQDGLVFKYDEPLHENSQVWIETEAGRNLGWDIIVDGKTIELRPAGGDERLKRNAIYVVRLNVADVSGNGARERTIVFAT